MLIVYCCIFALVVICVIIWAIKPNEVTRLLTAITITMFIMSFAYMVYDLYRKPRQIEVEFTIQDVMNEPVIEEII